jgi:hypothetical protein
MHMPEHQKTGHITSLFAFLLITVLLTGACTSAPASPAQSLPVTAPIIPAGTPAASGTTTVHGTVSDLYRMNCPCFTLVTGKGNLTVWYDLMISPDGTRRPAVAVDNLTDGEEIQVTGILQAEGKFWAQSISPARPVVICNCPMEPAVPKIIASTPTPDDGLCHCP